MTDTLTVIGTIGTEPRSIDTSSGTAMTSFRLASTQRRYDRSEQRWVDVSTNWYTVTAFNGLAGNALSSLSRGDRILVTGRLGVRAWEAGGKAGTDVVLTAEGIGHDLAWGTSSFTKTVGRASAPAPAAEPAWSEEAPREGAAAGDWGASGLDRGDAAPEPPVAAGVGGGPPGLSVGSGETPF
ncbi:single-stranded DNA-binding protein [Rathayibacter sp. AY1E4]|uniref:single-stranded DNA-binding protein n=1 Tax=unclassified Rathayibacter TaxID=2609250 RepID=UPI000CE8A1A8|nr:MULTISPECIES: single-stranded DNA-binding protein [unclassified Rathayibacter]PPG60202.1 single-stranded DNA-binding protein [Rathayibacter sp. AY1C5]PPH20193.1 single-stranded DNA-binding protein [Rathayibacter sp. AY1C4]PPH42614.1 single-stranded DNA-binding protein [Rathayibacter sp. AY1E4]